MNKVLRIDLLVITAAAVTVFSSLVGVSIPLLLRRLIDGPKPQLFFNASILLAAFLFQTGFVVLGDYLMAKSGERQVETLRERLTNTLIHANMSFLDHQQSGDLTSHVINDANSIRTFFSGTLAQFIAGVVTIIGSLIALVLLDVRLSLVLVACLPVVLLVVVPVSNLAEKYAERLQKQTGRTNAFLTATFRQSELIKASTAEEEASSSASGLFQGLYNSALKADWLQAVSSPLVLLALFGAVAVIFAYGGQRVAAGSLSIGTLMSFLIYVFQLLNPIGGLSSFFTDLAKMNGATKRLRELALAKPEVESGHLPTQKGELKLTDVCFDYGDGNPVLEHIDITIPADQKTALVGPSGGGKSTIVSLLERFYPVTKGQVSLAGVPAEEYGLEAWRQNIALVSQTNDIQNGTIRDNLLFGLSKTFSESQIESALERAGLLREINNFPQGLETLVGEDGNLLSGGQRQRLQIARAYLKAPNFIIFDEATANLDADAEYQVTKSLDALLSDRGALIIAHRLSTITDADKIYFLENHRITGFGTHSELMKTHESYRRFVNEQIIE